MKNFITFCNFNLRFFKILLVLIIILGSQSVYSTSEFRISNKYILHSKSSANPIDHLPIVIIQRVKFDPNQTSTYIYNRGIFNQYAFLSNTPGFEWPKGSGKFAIFTSGITIAALVNNQLRMAAAFNIGEYVPGYIDGVGGPVMTDTRFRVYKVKSNDNASNNPDYAQWGDMVPFGAPFVDRNGNGQYDPGIDKPGIEDAEQTVFVCLTDGFPEEHTIGEEGFGGGTIPMLAEVRLTAWGYDYPGLANFHYIRFEIINKNILPWEGTYFSIPVDPDLGWNYDDYIGCDTLLNLGYCYNADNDDDTLFSPYAYGNNPPAVGISFIRGAISFSNTEIDTLGLTSFIYWGGPPCGNYLNPYNLMRGFKSDGTPWLNPTITSGTRITKFCFSGDPESGTGWTEYDGIIPNCNGDTSGNVILSPPGDRRFIISSGADDLTVEPGDTQVIVIAQMVDRGANHLNSVTGLKRLTGIAKLIYDSCFPPDTTTPPVVHPVFHKLYQNYPNPFNPITTIRYEVKEKFSVKIIVYDVTGKEIKKLVDEVKEPGSYTVEFNAVNLPSGIYFYKMKTGGYAESKKMVLLK